MNKAPNCWLLLVTELGGCLSGVDVGNIARNGSKSVLDSSSSTSPPAALTSPPKKIYQLLNHWTAQGIAILLITSEMIELLTLSDRIAVMHRGPVTTEFSRNQGAPNAVLLAALESISLVHTPDFHN